MCGRYSLTTPVDSLSEAFGFSERPNLEARVNIAPSQEIAAVRIPEDEDTRHFAWLRWGLIPAWAKEADSGNRMINARAETLAEKPSFRDAFARRRCLIPADGFYEWKTEGGRKQPYRITRRDGAPFAFAGLWERWIGLEQRQTIESCSIITTGANDLLKPIHHRMPVILAAPDFDAWLDPGRVGTKPGEAVQNLLKPCGSENWIAYPVSPRINSPANDEASLMEPVEVSAGEPAGEPSEATAQLQLL